MAALVGRAPRRRLGLGRHARRRGWLRWPAARLRRPGHGDGWPRRGRRCRLGPAPAGPVGSAWPWTPGRLARRRTGELALLATRGVAAIEPYLTRYLPALVLAAVLPALTVAGDLLARLAQRADRAAHAAAGAGLRDPDRAGHPGPRRAAVAGCRCCRATSSTWSAACRRWWPPPGRVPRRPRSGAITDRYRRATLETLRLAFASSAVLELVATISVALVAVTVGLRLVGGHARPADRAGRAAARPRGLLAAAPRRRGVPRRRRGRRGLRGGLLAAPGRREPDAAPPADAALPRPGCGDLVLRAGVACATPEPDGRAAAGRRPARAFPSPA